jgi:hypothetical protein
MPDLFLKTSAVISPCGKYRYALERIWEENQAGPLVFIMLR